MNYFCDFFDDYPPEKIIEDIANYDFRVEYINEGYKKTCEVEDYQFHSNFLFSKDPAEKFITYKVLTEYPCKFDADNSLGTCSLMGEIYNKLWGTMVEYSNFMTIKDLFYEDGKKLLFGGDIYNSLQVSIGLSKYDCIRLYIKDPKELRKRLCSVQEVMNVSHVLGNFGLVPAYYNSYRGINKEIRDYLDHSLLELKQKGFNYLNILIEKNRSKEKNRNLDVFVNKIKSEYRDFDTSDYIKYINLMFLWDMHIGENQIYDISSSVQKWNAVVPQIIRRRSLFMAMMLFFSCKRTDIYKNIIEKIYNSNKLLDYESVFLLIENEENLTKFDVEILKTVKEKILRIMVKVNEEIKVL